MRNMITILSMLVFLSLGYSQDKMNYEEEYLPKLQKAQAELAKIEAEIASEKTQTETLNTQISEAEAKKAQIWAEIYQLVGTDENGVNDYRSKLDALDSKVRSFGSLPAEELYKRKAELDQYEAELNSLRSDKISALTEFINKIDRIDQKIKSIRSSMVVPYVTSYVVKRGDSLWRISGKKDIYDDPFKWTDIYKANKETISSWQRKYNAVLKEGQKEADLIYPEQEFTIPR
jgi:nucleoid-associated protein YgaU